MTPSDASLQASVATHANLGSRFWRNDALARLSVLEQPLLLAALAAQPFAQREVVGDVDRAHDRVQRRLRQLAQLDRQRERGGLGILDEPVDQAHRERLLGVRVPGGQHQVQRAAAADEARQPLRPARPGDQPELDLGEPEARAGRADPQRAGQRQLEAAAEREPVDGGDRDALGRGQPVERGAQRVAVGLERGGVDRRHVLDVGAGGEDAGDAGDDDEQLGVAGLVERRVEACDQRQAERVGRRALERDQGDAGAAVLGRDDRVDLKHRPTPPARPSARGSRAGGPGPSARRGWRRAARRG